VRTKIVIGKKIVAVRQGRKRIRDGSGPGCFANVVEALILEDGTELHPRTIETEYCVYEHEFHVVPKGMMLANPV